MKTLPYIDDLIAKASTPLAKTLFEEFATAFGDKTLNSSDYVTLLKEVMEKSLTETDSDAAA